MQALHEAGSQKQSHSLDRDGIPDVANKRGLGIATATITSGNHRRHDGQHSARVQRGVSDTRRRADLRKPWRIEGVPV